MKHDKGKRGFGGPVAFGGFTYTDNEDPKRIGSVQYKAYSGNSVVHDSGTLSVPSSGSLTDTPSGVRGVTRVTVSTFDTHGTQMATNTKNAAADNQIKSLTASTPGPAERLDLTDVEEAPTTNP